MIEPTVHSTFVIERSFAKSPARVFTAFSDPNQKRRWYIDENGHEAGEYTLDFRQGGAEHASYRMREGSPLPGLEMSSDAIFAEIQPGRRIVFYHKMSLEGRPFSAALITLEFNAEGEGTTLLFTHQGAFFEHADGPAMREHGWGVLFDRVAASLED